MKVIYLMIVVLLFTGCIVTKSDLSVLEDKNDVLIKENKELKESNMILLDKLDECEYRNKHD